MISYTLVPREGAPPRRLVHIGWDAPLSSFFVHVLDTLPDGEPLDVKWIGASPHEVADVDVALRVVTAYAAVPRDLRQKLLNDQAREGDRFADRPGADLIIEMMCQAAEGAGFAAPSPNPRAGEAPS